MPPELSLSPRLEGLVNACQKACVVACCGIEAYDFSPLHIASYLSAFSGSISEEEIANLDSEIDELISKSSALTPDAQGTVCSIKGMNQYFSEEQLVDLADQLKRGIRQSSRVLEYANRLQCGHG